MAIVASVLSTRRYAAVAAAGAAGLGLAYYALTMSLLPAHFGAAAGAAPASLAASLGLTATVSVLGGINFAMMAYRASAAKSAGAARSGSATVAGAAAAFTPGCPACTAPLAVVLGAVGGLAAFPLHGLELKILSAGALLFSLYWVARGVQNSRGCCRAELGPDPGAAGDRGARGCCGARRAPGA